jgi:SulP family sulfate permease
MHNLKDVVREIQHSGTKVVLSGVQPNVQKELERSNFFDLMEPQNVLPAFDQALKRAKTLLDE